MIQIENKDFIITQKWRESLYGANYGRVKIDPPK